MCVASLRLGPPAFPKPALPLPRTPRGPPSRRPFGAWPASPRASALMRRVLAPRSSSRLSPLSPSLLPSRDRLLRAPPLPTFSLPFSSPSPVSRGLRVSRSG